jgi:hypothetical protein
MTGVPETYEWFQSSKHLNGFKIQKWNDFIFEIHSIYTALDFYSQNCTSLSVWSQIVTIYLDT